MGSNKNIVIHWFRRDLRLDDNAALYHALKSNTPVLPIFIFDATILDQLENRTDHRVIFIHRQLQQLQEQLQKLGSGLITFFGTPEECWKDILESYSVSAVYTNHDVEPYAIQRDEKIKNILLQKNIPFHTYKDQVIFEKDEVVKDDGKPYTVYTPYSKRWLRTLTDFNLTSYPTEKYFGNFRQHSAGKIHSLKEMNFRDEEVVFPSTSPDKEIIKKYADQRDIPSINGTTHMSIHLRFGTVSIRKLARLAQATSDTWLNELCWREFYMQILWHFPHVVKGAFKPAYDAIQWRNNEDEFKHWCNGTTGYPIVDAGMRELNATGFMHNRVRMIVSSFLTKHLLIDWRWGEAYFAEKLLDFELASNNGGWQWAAGSGVDAAPYFRIFNPYEQTKRFDPDFKYIRKWVPEYSDFGYPPPIVDHKFARERCLETYKRCLIGYKDEHQS
jgi:deoxyribodipyrimidine photo-lyase